MNATTTPGTPPLAVQRVAHPWIAAIGLRLWPGIVWHFLYDFISYATGDVLTTAAVVALAVELVILAVYAARLWRLLPR